MESSLIHFISIQTFNIVLKPQQSQLIRSPSSFITDSCISVWYMSHCGVTMKQQRTILACPVLWIKYNPTIETGKVRQQPTNMTHTIRKHCKSICHHSQNSQYTLLFQSLMSERQVFLTKEYFIQQGRILLIKK